MKQLDVLLKYGLIPAFVCSLFVNSALSQESAAENFKDCQTWEDGSFRTDPGAIGAAFECLFKKIDKLEEELRPFRRAKGAVIAFDRSEKIGSCPKGWSFFDQAGGRTIIGAGEHGNQGVSAYPSFSDNPNRAIGGEETVKLSHAQMPPHSHRQRVGQHAQSGAKIDSWNLRGPGGAVFVGNTDTSGDGDAHNNMPPYIALYYCKKD